MKNAIMYYYNINSYDIHQNKKTYYFTSDNYKYVLSICNIDFNIVKDIYELSLELMAKGIYFHQIILNVSNNLITMINNEPYILMRIINDNKGEIILDDIITLNNITVNDNPKGKVNWDSLWAQKIDYFEEQIHEFGINYPIIRSSFSYFVGLAENAIQLVKEVNYDYDLFVAHRRIKSTDSLFDLYNPLNLIIDTKARDTSEYFKSKFFESNLDINEIKAYLNSGYLNTYEMYLFLARMFYPSPYFDIYEKIINESLKENSLYKIINKINEYEKFLKNLYLYMRTFIYLPDIEWLIKT